MKYKQSSCLEKYVTNGRKLCEEDKYDGGINSAESSQGRYVGYMRVYRDIHAFCRLL